MAANGQRRRSNDQYKHPYIIDVDSSVHTPQPPHYIRIRLHLIGSAFCFELRTALPFSNVMIDDDAAGKYGTLARTRPRLYLLVRSRDVTLRAQTAGYDLTKEVPIVPGLSVH